MPGSPVVNHAVAANIPVSSHITHGSRLKRANSSPAIALKPSHVHNATETLSSKVRRASLSGQSSTAIRPVTHHLQKNSTPNSKFNDPLEQKLDVLKKLLDTLAQNSQDLPLKADTLSSTWSHWIASWVRPGHPLANFDKAIARYNKNANNLVRTIHDLKTLNSICLSNVLAQERVHATTSALTALQKQLVHIADQANRLMRLPTPPEYIATTVLQVQTLQSRIEGMQQTIDAIKGQENNLRSARTAVENYINHIHQHNPLDLEPIEDEHCIWLYELKQKIGNSLLSTVTEQQLSQALMAVLKYGKPLPKDLEAFVTVLQLFFPIKEVANAILEEQATNRIRYFNLLTHLNKNNITEAKKQIDSLEDSRKTDEQMRHQLTIALQHYYKVLLQTKPFSNTEKETFNFFQSSDEDRKSVV